MGPIRELMSMIPGLPGLDFSEADKELLRIEAMICSMTPTERNNPRIIDEGRERRIASGSGTSLAEVRQLLGQFGQTTGRV